MFWYFLDYGVEIEVVGGLVGNLVGGGSDVVGLVKVLGMVRV